MTVHALPIESPIREKGFYFRNRRRESLVKVSFLLKFSPGCVEWIRVGFLYTVGDARVFVLVNVYVTAPAEESNLWLLA